VQTSSENRGGLIPNQDCFTQSMQQPKDQLVDLRSTVKIDAGGPRRHDRLLIQLRKRDNFRLGTTKRRDQVEGFWAWRLSLSLWDL